MAIAIGTQLGSLEIAAFLGKGGMGEGIGLIDAETTKSGATIAPQIQIVLNWFQELK